MKWTGLRLLVCAALSACGMPVTTITDAGGDTVTAQDSSTDTTVLPGTIRVYVAGESIERRNRFVAAPFEASGALNARGGGAERNDNDEYGWMIPMVDRLRLRASSITVQFVGAATWLGADDNPYSGSYPSSNAAPSSAISGTDIMSWLDQRRAELTAKTHCYDVAFVSRGGNDFGNDNDADYKTQLKDLIQAVDSGSQCRTHPAVYVTAHMPDDQGNPRTAATVTLQTQRFVTRTREAVMELQAAMPALRLRFVDVYTPFINNQPTTAFPNEVWSTGGIPDFDKIARMGDGFHPRRLASIYVGELIADAIQLTDLQ